MIGGRRSLQRLAVMPAAMRMAMRAMTAWARGAGRLREQTSSMTPRCPRPQMPTPGLPLTRMPTSASAPSGQCRRAPPLRSRALDNPSHSPISSLLFYHPRNFTMSAIPPPIHPQPSVGPPPCPANPESSGLVHHDDGSLPCDLLLMLDHSRHHHGHRRNHLRCEGESFAQRRRYSCSDQGVEHCKDTGMGDHLHLRARTAPLDCLDRQRWRRWLQGTHYQDAAAD